MVKVYHHTNEEAYRSILTGEKYGKKGLIPVRSAISRNLEGLPEKAYQNILWAFLEPFPLSWINSKEHPYAWNALEHRLFYNWGVGNNVLLSFDLTSMDDAYVLERAYVERDLTGIFNCYFKRIDEKIKRLWDSRQRVSEYTGNFLLPEIMIFHSIDFDRINIEQIMTHREFKKKVDSLRSN